MGGAGRARAGARGRRGLLAGAPGGLALAVGLASTGGGRAALAAEYRVDPETGNMAVPEGAFFQFQEERLLPPEPALPGVAPRSASFRIPGRVTLDAPAGPAPEGGEEQARTRRPALGQSSPLARGAAEADWRGFRDTVTGAPVCLGVSIAVAPTPLGSISETGPLGEASPQAVLGLLPEQYAGDLVAVSRREGGGGLEHFEWDLAWTSGSCGFEERRLLGTCPYEWVGLVSATVSGGGLYIFSVAADSEQFKRFGSDLRDMRKSWRVEPGPPGA